MKGLLYLVIALFLINHIGAEQIESCDSEIYCYGKLLHTIQMARLYPDSKTFVDMSQKNDPKVTLENFNKLLKEKQDKPSKDDLRKFVADNFESNGELVNWIPTDFNPNPAFLNRITNPKVKEFATTLVNIWPKLARKVNNSVAEHQERHSLIHIPNGFIIPGGRFTEIYYWDSYWIIKGLLLSEMKDTVRGILENFLSLINKFGFIPNGSRVYYLNRSQPPIFASMVGLYIDATRNKTWLRQNIDTIEKELNWWWNNRRYQIKKDNKEYDMFKYAVASATPRPESYAEDVLTCEKFKPEDQATCYINLKSGAESGWDYSTRWLFNKDRTTSTNLSLIDITHVVPVDLNAFLVKAFGQLVRFFEMLGVSANEAKITLWKTRQQNLKQAIREVMYNENDGIWYDFDEVNSQQRKGFYPSNFVPLWADAYDLDKKENYGLKAASYYKRNRIQIYLGGVPTSLINSGQQWDLPNAWPPLQDFIVSGLKKTGVKKARRLAEAQAKITVASYMQGYDDTKEMFEKYDAFTPGGYGGGGEYTLQTGFGWSNGGALQFIEQFYTTRQKRTNPGAQNDSEST